VKGRKRRTFDSRRLSTVKAPSNPNWRRVILELRGMGVHTSALSMACGMEKSGLRHYVGGKRPVRKVPWTVGQYLLAVHKEFSRDA
jgi:hypothetical protein